MADEPVQPLFLFGQKDKDGFFIFKWLEEK